MKKFYKLIPLLFLGVSVPTSIVTTACSGIYSNVYEITSKQLQSNVAVKNLKHGPDLKSLFYGGKANHHGNYVLFISTQSSRAVNNLLFSGKDEPTTCFDKNTAIGNNGATLNYDSFNTITSDIKDLGSNHRVGGDIGFY